MVKETSIYGEKGEGVAGAIGLHKTLQVKKIVGTSDEDWNEVNLKAVSMIQLWLADEIMYNVIDEETTLGLWSRLETLCMIKSLSNKLYLKK